MSVRDLVVQAPDRRPPDRGASRVRAPRATAPVPGGRRGRLGLSAILITAALACVGAAHTDSLLPQSIRPAPADLAGAFGGLGLDLHVVGTIAVLLVMLGAYLLVAHPAARLSTRSVLLTIVLVHVLVVLAPPLVSTDVFSYQAYARMGAQFGVNPYTHGPYAIRFDSVFPYVGARWSYIPSVYGPVFTAFSYLLAPLTIVASVLAYKLIAAVASLALLAVVWRCARLRDVDPVRAVAFVGLNPLLVLYGVGGGHNDLVMLLALALGLWALLAARERTGGALAVLAVGIKLTAAILLPFALLARGRERPPGARRRLIVGAALAAIPIAVLAVLVFGSGSLHILATVRQSQSEGSWMSIPGAISTRLGLPGVARVVRDGLVVVFALTTFRLLLAVWRGRMDWVDGAGWATLVLLVCASSLLPWYVAWALPFAALTRERRLGYATLGLTTIVSAIQLLGYIPHG